jgi:glycine cleavage system H protein
MSDIPETLKYTKEHEWIRLEEDGTVTICITDYAQTSLGDITFVELPEVDESFGAGAPFGVVESVKAASDLYMPVSGKVIAVNSAIEGSPETVNSDPYGEAWMVRVKLEDPASVGALLDAAAYAEIV